MYEHSFRAVVIGSSAGGFKALTKILPMLPVDFKLPIFIAQHRDKNSDDYLTTHLNNVSSVYIRKAVNNDIIKPGIVYFAPPNTHMLIKTKGLLTITDEDMNTYSKPSIDALFKSAANVYENSLIGVILTGASDDGAKGIVEIKKYDGFTIAQNPAYAKVPYMPRSAIETKKIDFILPLREIIPFILNIIGSE